MHLNTRDPAVGYNEMISFSVYRHLTSTSHSYFPHARAKADNGSTSRRPGAAFKVLSKVCGGFYSARPPADVTIPRHLLKAAVVSATHSRRRDEPNVADSGREEAALARRGSLAVD